MSKQTNELSELLDKLFNNLDILKKRYNDLDIKLNKMEEDRKEFLAEWSEFSEPSQKGSMLENLQHIQKATLIVLKGLSIKLNYPKVSNQIIKDYAAIGLGYAAVGLDYLAFQIAFKQATYSEKKAIELKHTELGKLLEELTPKDASIYLNKIDISEVSAALSESKIKEVFSILDVANEQSSDASTYIFESKNATQQNMTLAEFQNATKSLGDYILTNIFKIALGSEAAQKHLTEKLLEVVEKTAELYSNINIVEVTNSSALNESYVDNSAQLSTNLVEEVNYHEL